MTRFRFRHKGAWYELPPAEFVVGRAPGCQLVFDDPRVSRRHARFFTDLRRVTLEDLGSRNGTLVNGVLLRGPQVLSHHDIVVIGSQELTFTTAPVDDQSARLATSAVPAAAEHPCEVTLSGGLTPLITLVERAHHLGSTETTERALDQAYASLDADVASMRSPSPVALEGITHVTLVHVAGTRNGRYLDQLFRLYHRFEVVMPKRVVEEVHSLARRVGQYPSAEMRAYAEWLRSKAASHDPAERVALQELEEMVRTLKP